MTEKYSRDIKKTESVNSVDLIYDQMESNPHYPFNVQSGWMPEPNSPAFAKFLKMVLNAEPTELADSVKALDTLLTNNEVLTFLINDACAQNGNITASDSPSPDVVKFPRIATKDDLLKAFNTLLHQPPYFIDDELVGLPFSGLVVGIDPTQSGMTLFRLPMFNSAMKAILNEWHTFLASLASNTIFGTEGEQWLSAAAKKQYQFEIWEKDNKSLPYWNSWNSFFTRQFKDQNHARPIAKPEDNRFVVSANDGSLFRWEEGIKAKDVFWFKDMPYSLTDILSSADTAQQEIIDNYDLVNLFSDGYIFQTYLNPYNYHRWWCPVNGSVLFDPIAIDGNYFNKLVIPDFGGGTTASLPYLVQVNARGLIVFKTEDYGYACCIPLGMSEVSTIAFHDKMKQGSKAKKGAEMGMFQYGGSSFVMVFQKLPGKKLFFQSGSGQIYEKRPVLPKSSSSTGGNVTLIGSQIGKWEEVNTVVDSTQPWQNTGYINSGCQYRIKYVGGLWTANPNINDGNLHGPEGSGVTATQSSYPLDNQREGALIARVGNHIPFLVGRESVVTPAGQFGQLQLCINDDLSQQYGSGLKDNEGAIAVSITPEFRTEKG